MLKKENSLEVKFSPTQGKNIRSCLGAVQVAMKPESEKNPIIADISSSSAKFIHSFILERQSGTIQLSSGSSRSFIQFSLKLGEKARE